MNSRIIIYSPYCSVTYYILVLFSSVLLIHCHSVLLIHFRSVLIHSLPLSICLILILLTLISSLFLTLSLSLSLSLCYCLSLSLSLSLALSLLLLHHQLCEPSNKELAAVGVELRKRLVNTRANVMKVTRSEDFSNGFQLLKVLYLQFY